MKTFISKHPTTRRIKVYMSSAIRIEKNVTKPLTNNV